MIDEQMMLDYEQMEDDVLRFECWYHSVVDDVANLIRSNGYDKVMLDVHHVLERLELKDNGQ